MKNIKEKVEAKLKESNKEEKKGVNVTIEPMNLKGLKIKIKGLTPLLMDKFPERAKLDILGKQTGISKSGKKKVRDTKEETLEAVHVTASGKIGYPAHGFKMGMMESTSFVGDKFFSKKLVSGAVKIMNAEDGLIPIRFKKQSVLTHNIECNTKFSPQFHDWECELVITYDANNISPNDIVTLLNYSGFYVGIGAWRPKGKKGGSGEFGMYKVDMGEQKK